MTLSITRAFGISTLLALAAWSCTSKDEGSHSSGTPGGASGSGAASGGAAGTAAGSGGSNAAGSGSSKGGSGNAPAQGGSGNAGSAGAPRGGGGGDANGGGTDAGTSGTGGAGGTTGGMGNAGRSSGGMGSGAGGTDAAGAGGDPGTGGCTPSDEFEDTSIDPCWLELNGTPQNPLIALAENDGALHLSANGSQGGVWYQGATKSLLYQVVSVPRFTLTTIAHPRKVTAPDSLPTKDLHVGGLMVRDPASAGGNTENYVFLMVGHSEMNNGMVHQGVEFKSTADGCSNWDEPDWGENYDEPDAELRICRIGAEFRMFKRVPGDAAWTPATPPSPSCAGNAVSGNVLTRADLPEAVQVGLALNFNAPSDLDVAFDFIHFVELPADATGDDCTAE